VSCTHIFFVLLTNRVTHTHTNLTHVHTIARTHTSTQSHTDRITQTHTHTRTHTHLSTTHTQTHTHTYAHTHTHTCPLVLRGSHLDARTHLIRSKKVRQRDPPLWMVPNKTLSLSVSLSHTHTHTHTHPSSMNFAWKKSKKVTIIQRDSSEYLRSAQGSKET